MTPGAPSYLPGTPGGQPMTPGSGGLDIMSPITGKLHALVVLCIFVAKSQTNYNICGLIFL